MVLTDTTWQQKQIFFLRFFLDTSCGINIGSTRRIHQTALTFVLDKQEKFDKVRNLFTFDK
jgi:hypothetical protein